MARSDRQRSKTTTLTCKLDKYRDGGSIKAPTLIHEFRALVADTEVVLPMESGYILSVGCSLANGKARIRVFNLGVDHE
jgi:hypothetical protein